MSLPQSGERRHLRSAEASATVGQYQRDGHVLLRGALDRPVIDALRDRIAAQVSVHARTLLADGRVRSLYEGESFERRLALLHAEARLPLRKWSRFMFGPEMYRLVTQTRLLDGLEALLGPDITFHGDYQVIPKLPLDETTAFPWHQDTWYYGVASRHMHVVTVWLPLVEADEDNGCLWLVPGSHGWGLLPAVRDDDLKVRTLEDPERRGVAVPMPMQPGDALLMGNLTFHSSRVNRSQGVRWTMDLGFSATRGTQPTTPAEARSYDYLLGMLYRIGRTTLRVRRGDGGPIETFAEWQRRRDRQLAELGEQAGEGGKVFDGSLYEPGTTPPH